MLIQKIQMINKVEYKVEQDKTEVKIECFAIHNKSCAEFDSVHIYNVHVQLVCRAVPTQYLHGGRVP